MKIVMAASEGMPFSKTGGLADVIGSLPLEMQELGQEVMIFLPRYKSVDLQKWKMKVAVDPLVISIGNTKETGKVYSYTHQNGLEFYLVDHPQFFTRDELYGTPLGDYPDNDRRFIFFQRSVFETLKALNIKPDIIHCHDWQTGLIPVYLKTLYGGDTLFKKTKSFFTIHNLAYQGNFPPDSLPLTGLGWDQFKIEKLEYYGKVSFLKGGIIYADAITTVSESYAQQILTKEFGCGFEGILTKRRDKLFGIVNGINYEEWNPETDTDITATYNFKTFHKKAESKIALQRENELKVDPDVPVFGVVSRLVDQKGIDILVPALKQFPELGAQFVLLGTGEEKYHQIFRDIAKKNKGRFGIHILFDPKMAKRVYAGCDFLLIPSYYEPCGLAQMIALRFGTVPVARATGGLRDTIREFEVMSGEGNGFLFEEYTTEALVKAIEHALNAFKDKKTFRNLVRNAMESDFSWTASAKKYIDLFEEIGPRRMESLEKM